MTLVEINKTEAKSEMNLIEIKSEIKANIMTERMKTHSRN